MDTSFFIKAFAASPRAVVPGYGMDEIRKRGMVLTMTDQMISVIGGIAYFAIPWGLGTLMSSVVLGLESNPIFPTYPRVWSSLVPTSRYLGC